MSRFLELNVVFTDDDDSALHALGLGDGKTKIDVAMLDIDEIQSFYASAKPGETEKLYTSIIMRTTNDVWTVTMPYNDFKELFKTHR